MGEEATQQQVKASEENEHKWKRVPLIFNPLPVAAFSYLEGEKLTQQLREWRHKGSFLLLLQKQ